MSIQPSGPLSSPSPPAFNLSQYQGLFQWVSSLYQVAKVLELQLQHQSFHEYSGLISFRMDWFDLLTVQGTLKSLLQHHSSKASILGCLAFSLPYMTTGKTTAFLAPSNLIFLSVCWMFSKCDLGTPESPWSPFRESARSKLFSYQYWLYLIFNSHSFTNVNFSGGYKICDIQWVECRGKYEIPIIFKLTLS